VKSRGCRAGDHDFEGKPYAVDAGYQQMPDGTRVDGQWLRYRCRRCHHTAERWLPEGAPVPEAPRQLHTGADELAAEPATPFWERPALIWAIIVIVLALAAYGYVWDSRVRSAGQTGPEVIKPQAAPAPAPGQ
jgi:hypothetical protein